MKEKSIRRCQCLILCIFLWIGFLFSACDMDVLDCSGQKMQETQCSQYFDDTLPDVHPVYFLTDNTIPHRWSAFSLRNGKQHRMDRALCWISFSAFLFILGFFCITNPNFAWNNVGQRTIRYIHDKDGMK